jgi:hypothetical protein
MIWNILKHNALKLQEIRCWNYTFLLLKNNLIFSDQRNGKHFQRHTDGLCYAMIYEQGWSENGMLDSLVGIFYSNGWVQNKIGPLETKISFITEVL